MAVKDSYSAIVNNDQHLKYLNKYVLLAGGGHAIHTRQDKNLAHRKEKYDT